MESTPPGIHHVPSTDVIMYYNPVLNDHRSFNPIKADAEEIDSVIPVFLTPDSTDG